MINNINLFPLLFLFILLTLSFFVIGFSFFRSTDSNNIQIPIALALGMSFTVIYLTVTLFLSIPKLYSLLTYFIFVLVNLFHFRKEILNTLYSSKLNNWFNVIFLFFLNSLFIFFSSNEPGLWDDTMYHLPYAKDFSQNNFSYPNLSFRYFFPLIYSLIIFPFTVFSIKNFEAISYVLSVEALSITQKYKSGKCNKIHQVYL